MEIKEMRFSLGWTQQKFSDYFGIPKRTIEEWESGRMKCRPYVLRLIEYKLKNENLLKD